MTSEWYHELHVPQRAGKPHLNSTQLSISNSDVTNIQTTIGLPCELDLWPSDLKTGPRVTCNIGVLHVNSRLLRSPVRVRGRQPRETNSWQTDRQDTIGNSACKRGPHNNICACKRRYSADDSCHVCIRPVSIRRRVLSAMVQWRRCRMHTVPRIMLLKQTTLTETLPPITCWLSYTSCRTDAKSFCQPTSVFHQFLVLALCRYYSIPSPIPPIYQL